MSSSPYAGGASNKDLAWRAHPHCFPYHHPWWGTVSKYRKGFLKKIQRQRSKEKREEGGKKVTLLPESRVTFTVTQGPFLEAEAAIVFCP